MSTEAVETSVSSSIVVDAPIERAFSVFTEGIGTWFPPSTTSSTSRSKSACSSRARVAASTTAAPMGASAAGLECSPTSRPTES